MRRHLRPSIVLFSCAIIFFLSSCSGLVTHRGMPVDDEFAKSSARALRGAEITGRILLDTIASGYQVGAIKRSVASRAVDIATQMHGQLRVGREALSAYLDTGGSEDAIRSTIALIRSMLDEMAAMIGDAAE